MSVMLQFVLEGWGMVHQIEVSEFEARQIIQSFINGTLKEIIGNGNTPNGRNWAIRASKIVAVWAITFEDLQRARMAQAPPQYGQQIPGKVGPIGFGGSGL